MTEYLPGIVICGVGLVGIAGSITGMIYTIVQYGKKREALLKQLENE